MTLHTNNLINRDVERKKHCYFLSYFGLSLQRTISHSNNNSLHYYTQFQQRKEIID